MGHVLKLYDPANHEPVITHRSGLLREDDYDHRWIDGHKAAQFNARLKQILEEADFAHELGLEPA